MNDDIKTVYVCNICHTHYDTIDACRKCLKSHKDEQTGVVIELGTFLGAGMLKDYDFDYTKFRIHAHGRPDEDVKTYGLYGGWPLFRTECLHTPEEVLKAKRRLLDAAFKWIDDYLAKVRKMQAELEGGDKQ